MSILYMKYYFYILVIFILIIGILFLLLKQREGFTTDATFVKNQEDYYESRQQGSIFDNLEQGDEFYQYDPTKNIGNQLTTVDPDVKHIGYAQVDNAVQQCKKMTSCDDLDNSPCGYCFYDDRFYYGNEKGPYTDVCPGDWVKTKKECQEKRERAICEKVKSCHEMTGEASICAWCPTKKKAFVYKKQNGKLVPKYPDKDQCTDETLTGEELGLVSADQCSQFEKDHPCIGPTEDTGPHSLQCLNHLWKRAGGTPQGTASPQNSEFQRNWWNNRGWKAVFNDMKLWVRDANSSNWNVAKKRYKGVYGKDPDPCSNQFKGDTPLACFQDLFVKQGCTNKGSGYPTTLADVSKITSDKSKVQYSNQIKDIISMSQNIDLDYAKRNKYYNYCYGSNLASPPPAKVGDYVKHIFNFPLSGWGEDTELYGYVCKINGGNAQVFWEKIQNGKNVISRDDNLNNRKLMNEWFGTYCGQIPEKLDGYIPGMISLKDLHIVRSCNVESDCNDAGCSMQNIVYVHKPGKNYSISKKEIGLVIQKMKEIFPSATMCQIEDIQFMVDSGVPYCACGWVIRNGQYTSVYPSVKGTNRGCGGGNVRVISCGNNGPSWANGLAGIYMKITETPNKVSQILDKNGYQGGVIMTVGKNEYETIKGVAVNTKNMNVKIDDPKNYELYGPWIHNNRSPIPVVKIIDEGKSGKVYLGQDGSLVKLVKIIDGKSYPYYYSGNVNEYGSKPLRKAGAGDYKLRRK